MSSAPLEVLLLTIAAKPSLRSLATPVCEPGPTLKEQGSPPSHQMHAHSETLWSAYVILCVYDNCNDAIERSLGARLTMKWRTPAAHQSKIAVCRCLALGQDCRSPTARPQSSRHCLPWCCPQPVLGSSQRKVDASLWKVRTRLRWAAGWPAGARWRNHRAVGNARQRELSSRSHRRASSTSNHE